MRLSSMCKAIERCDKRIAKAKNKAKYSRSDKDRIDASEAIRENELKKLRIQQQIAFKSAMKAAH